MNKQFEETVERAVEALFLLVDQLPVLKNELAKRNPYLAHIIDD